LLRHRPIAFGLLAGFAFLHREFAAYAIAAIVAIDVLTGRFFSRDRIRDYTISFGMFALVIFVVNLLKQKADLLGPGTAGTIDLGTLGSGSAWSGLICWSPEELRPNVRWLFVENLGMMFNWKPDLLGPENWTPVPAGHPWLVGVLIAFVALAIGQAVRARAVIGDRWEFAGFLVLVGVEAAFAYAVLGCHVRDASLLRYTLLTLFIPAGLALLFFASRPQRSIRLLMSGLIAVWAGASFLDNARFLTTYIHRPAPAPYRELANYLIDEGVRYGRALYWTAYQLDFLSGERLTIASLDKVRVAEYQRAADQHEAQVVRILPRQSGCHGGPLFRMWCFEELDRARGATQKP
jgi:hypothetical protein